MKNKRKTEIKNKRRKLCGIFKVMTIFAAEYERTSDSGQKRGKPFPAFKVAGVAAFSGGAQRQGIISKTTAIKKIFFISLPFLYFSSKGMKKMGKSQITSMTFG